MLTIKKMSIAIVIFVLFTQLTFGQDEMFSLIRKINVDHLGAVGQIDGCEFSKDNYYIIASDNHGTAKIYIRSSGKYVNEVKHIQINNLKFERAGKINAVGYSYDRKYFYTGINDYGLKLWNAETYTLVHHFNKTAEVDSADFSSDGKWLAVGADSEVCVYRMSDFTLVHKFSHKRGAVNHLDFSDDNTLLASVSSKGGGAMIHRTSDWSVFRRHSHKSRAAAVAAGERSSKRIYFSPDGELYVNSGRDWYCKVYRTSDGEMVADLKHRGNMKTLPGDDYGDEYPAIEAVHWSADGKHLLTGGVVDGIMRVWRRDDWSLIGYVQAQAANRQIEYIDVSSDNEVIVGGDEGVLYHYAFTPPELLKRFAQEPDGTVCLEAENYDTSLPQGGHSWTVISETGAAGGECLQALPNDGVKKDAKFAEYDPLKDSPKLDYRINFTRTGNYHVWIRAKGNRSDNSVHVGIDGKAVSSSDKIKFTPSTSNYVWSKATKDKQDAFISVSSVGPHTINVWMDEDGTKLDKILLTLDAGYDPSKVNKGKGPRGSIRKVPADQMHTGAESAFHLEPLWATQVDPRWHSGDSVGDIEDGITAEFVEFSADGRWLITGNGLGEALVLNAATGAIERRFSYITARDIADRTEFNISGGRTKGLEVECGAFTPDGRFLVLGGNLNGVKVFDLSDGSLVRHIKVDEEVDGLGISRDGRFFAHAAPRSVQVRRLRDWDIVASVRHGNKRGVTNSVDFTPDGGLMVSAGNYGHVILTRTADWRQVGDGLIGKTSSIKSVRFSPDTDLVAAGYGGANCAAVYRASDMSLLKHLPLFYIEALAWTSDSRFLMVGGRDGQGRMRVFRRSDWRLVGAPEVQADRSNIEYIDVHGELVAVAGEDGHVRLFRVASGN